MSILEKLVAEDFTIHGSNRWARTYEHDSLIIDRDNDVFFWNSKEVYGGPFDYLTKVRGMSFQDARNLLAKLDNTFGIQNQIVKQDITVYTGLEDLFWKCGKDNREYWYDRCLTDTTIDRFKLGYYDGWYLIPIRFEGELVNFQARRDAPKKTIRPWYRGKTPYLFNSSILIFVKTVYITEGIVDSILLAQYGIPAVSKNLGYAVWLTEWYKYFINIDTIYYIADNDLAGLAGAKRVADRLGTQRVRIVTFPDKKKGYDTRDFFKDGGTKDEFINYCDSNWIYSFSIPDKHFLQNKQVFAVA